MYALFADLKTAFDTVNREKLWEVMRQKGVSDSLAERIKGLYEETKCKVRIKEKTTDEFWTSKGLTQGCGLSRSYSIYM